MVFLAVLAGMLGLGWNARSSQPLPLIAPADFWNIEVPPGMEVTQEVVHAVIDGELEGLIVDVRSEDQYKAAHIPHAAWLSHEEIMAAQFPPELLQFTDPKSLIIFYCDGGSCDDSQLAAEKVQDVWMFSNVKVYAGGWGEWEAKGAAVEAGMP
jgi:rhodanese-related sulfurtransferase